MASRYCLLFSVGSTCSLFHENCWYVEGMLSLEAIRYCSVSVGLNIKGIKRWGGKVCWYTVKYKYMWITIVRSKLGAWLYCTQRENLASHVTAWNMIILYTEGQYAARKHTTVCLLIAAWLCCTQKANMNRTIINPIWTWSKMTMRVNEVPWWTTLV